MSTYDAGATAAESVAAAEDALYGICLSALAAIFPARVAALLQASDDLATARAQRDGLQRALDKANRDNDALRDRLRQVEIDPQPATAAVSSRLLVDRGEGDYSWVDETNSSPDRRVGAIEQG